MSEKKTLICRVQTVNLRAGGERPCADVALVDKEGATYSMKLEPGEKIDAIYGAWFLAHEVAVVANVAKVYDGAAVLSSVEKIEDADFWEE